MNLEVELVVFCLSSVDDWCGDFKAGPDYDQTSGTFSKLLLIFGSTEKKRQLADSYFNQGKWDQAVSVYEGLAPNDDPEISFLLSKCWWEIYYLNSDEAAARKIIQFRKIAADLGNAEAMYLLSLDYIQGKLVGEDVEIATDFLQRSAEAGYERAKRRLEKGPLTKCTETVFA